MSSLEDTFRDNVAVVTGAGSGIGEGLARHAASLGMSVVLADVAREKIERIADELRALGGEAMAVETDVSDPCALERLADITRETYGDVQVLFNNAGIETLGLSWEISREVWERTLDINIHGVVHGVRAFAPGMIRSGKLCFIANVSSIGGLGMMPVQSPYIMSKHAVLSFTECLHLEMKMMKHPVHVAAVLPGPVATRVFDDAVMASSEMVRAHRESMRAMLERDGISPAEAAKRIFQQLHERVFWISTHPEITAHMAGERARYLMQLSNPVLPEEMLASMGVVV